MAGHGRGEILAVFVGGCLGALLRGGLLEAVPAEPGSWPWATFVANLAGTALLAWLMLHLHHSLAATARRRRLLEPGLCGALTTISAMQLEILWMLDAGSVGLAAAYAVGGIAVGLAIALAGVLLTDRTRRAGGSARPGGTGAGGASTSGVGG